MFRLKPNGSQKLAPESVEVGLGHQADQLIHWINLLIADGALYQIYLILAPSLQSELVILDLLYGSSQIEQETALVLFAVGEVLDFLLADQIIEACAVLFIDQGLSPQQDAIAGHHVQLVEDDDVAWD